MVLVEFGQRFRWNFHKVPIILILLIVGLNAEQNGTTTLTPDVSSTGANNFGPARRHPQGGSESESASSTSSTPTPTRFLNTSKPTLILNTLPLIPRNFTSVPPNSVSSNINNSFFNDSSNPLKSRLKKKGLVFTLSLRPRERVYKPKSSTTTPSIPIPSATTTTTSATAVNTSSDAHSFSSKISDLTQASFGKNDDTKPKPDRSQKVASTTTKNYSASLTRGTNYGLKNVQKLNSTTVDGRVGKVIQIPSTTQMSLKIPITIKPSNDNSKSHTRVRPDKKPGFIANIGGYISNQDLLSGKKNGSSTYGHGVTITTPGFAETATTSTILPRKITSPNPIRNHKDGDFYFGSDSNSTSSNNGEVIEREETRYAITADQIGGNRPTERPFHFTTTLPTTTTTLETRKISLINVNGRFNNNNKPYSPHNHIYAPTQNPISIAHNEEGLSPEDIQRFHDAHSAYGSKVNGNGGGTLARTPSAAHSFPEDSVTRPTVVVSTTRFPPRGRNRPTIIQQIPAKEIAASPPGKKQHPESASSGRKNSHIKLSKQNSNSDANLPFYKEPGGVFEHKYSENDLEPNEVNPRFNDRAPGIRYAPKGPSTQAQQQQPVTYNGNQRHPNSYGHNQQPAHQPPHHNHNSIPAQSPQYVTVTQQPHYLTPAPVQQVHHHPTSYSPPAPAHYAVQNHHHHGPHPPPPQHQPHYYQTHGQGQPQPQPTPPAYFAPQHPPPPQQPIQNHHNHHHHHNQGQHPHQPLYNRGHGHGHAPPAHNFPPARPLPAPPITTVPAHNTYNAPPPTSAAPQYHFYSQDDDRNRNQKDFNNPPPKYDPASDYYYGDPRPSKSGQSSKKSPRKQKPKPDADYEDDEPEPVDYEDGPSSGRNNKKQGNRPHKPANNKYDDGGGRNNRIRDYNDGPANHSPGRDREPRRPAERPRKPERRPYETNNNNNDDYDTYPNENVGEYIRPQGVAKRPVDYDTHHTHPNDNVGEFIRVEGAPKRSNRDDDDSDADPNPEFVSLANNFEGGRGDGAPFRPSEEDRSLRPSQRDNNNHGPRFNHPNIEYSRNNNNNHDHRPPASPGEYRSINNNRDPTSLPPLDPIYTRTLKQYDEENQAPAIRQNYEPVRENEQYPDEPPDGYNDDNGRGQEDDDERPAPRRQSTGGRPNQNHNKNNNRPRPSNNRPRDEAHEPDEEDEVENEEHRRPSRPQQRRPVKEQEEEEEQEEEPEENERKPQRRKNNQKEEEPEEEEEEQEEEPEENERKPQRKKKQEEPEEEEEEEAPEEEEAEDASKGKKVQQRKEPKKPPPKKPQPEKPAGNLDDDILAIDREFGPNSDYGDPFGQQQQLSPQQLQNQQIHPAFQG